MVDFDLSVPNNSNGFIQEPTVSNDPLVPSPNVWESGRQNQLQAMLGLPAVLEMTDGTLVATGKGQYSSGENRTSAVLQPLADEVAPVYPTIAKVLTSPTVDATISAGAGLVANGSQMVEKALVSGKLLVESSAQDVGQSVRDLADSATTRWKASDNRAHQALNHRKEAWVDGLRALATDMDNSEWMAETRQHLGDTSERFGSLLEKLGNQLGYVEDAPLTRETAALEKAQQTLRNNLVDLSKSPDFETVFETSFGETSFGKQWDTTEAQSVVDEFIEGESGPTIEVLPEEVLRTEAAFGDNTIFVSDEFLAQTIDDPAMLVDVLFEEVGHYFDQALNDADSAGDEGAIFSKLAQGETIVSAELQELKREDDSATLQVGDRLLTVEQSNRRLAYEIQSGRDTLWAIAQRELGEGTRWKEIQKEDGSTFSETEATQLQLGDVVYVVKPSDEAVAETLPTPITPTETAESTSPFAYPGYVLQYSAGQPIVTDQNVERWQQRMQDLGWGIVVDGKYGPQSQATAQAFQLRYANLDNNGLVGPQTWAATFAADAQGPATVATEPPVESAAPVIPPVASPTGPEPNYLALVPISGVSSELTTPDQAFMTAALGDPNIGGSSFPYQNLIETRNVGPFTVTGLKPFLDDLREIFSQVRAEKPELYSFVQQIGLLNRRAKKDSSGNFRSGTVSNHSWGTAIDLFFGEAFDLKEDGLTNRGLIELAPYFQEKGYIWGARFSNFEDPGHFEASEELIQQWQASGWTADVASPTPSTPVATTPLSPDGYPGYALEYVPGREVRSNAAVRNWQQRMRDLGWEIAVDGEYGPQSRAIATSFQLLYPSLDNDGIVGPQTWSASFADDAKGPATSAEPVSSDRPKRAIEEDDPVAPTPPSVVPDRPKRAIENDVPLPVPPQEPQEPQENNDDEGSTVPSTIPSFIPSIEAPVLPPRVPTTAQPTIPGPPLTPPALEPADEPNYTTIPPVFSPSATTDSNTSGGKIHAFDLDFKTSGQSMWGAGNDIGFGINKFLGAEWNDPFSFKKFKVGLEGSTSGKAGIQADIGLHSGTVNAELPLDFEFILPEKITPGKTIKIGTAYTINEEAFFETFSPQAYASLDLIFQMKNNVDFTSPIKDFTLLNSDFSVNKELISLGLNPNDSAKLLDEKKKDLDPEETFVPGPIEDVEYNKSPEQQRREAGLGSYFNLALAMPDVDTKGTFVGGKAVSSKKDAFLTGEVDLDAIASLIVPTLPPLEYKFNQSGIKGEANLLDVSLFAKLLAQQEFELSLRNVLGQLEIENGHVLDFRVGDDILYEVPEDFDFGDSLDMTAMFEVETDLTNETDIVYDVGLGLKALAFSGKVPIRFAPDINFKTTLFDKEFSAFSGDAFSLYDSGAFELGGWNEPSHKLEIQIA